MKTIRPNDLVSVLTLVLQSMDSMSTDLVAKAEKLDKRVDADFEVLEPKVGELENALLSALLDQVVLPQMQQAEITNRTVPVAAPQASKKEQEDTNKQTNVTTSAASALQEAGLSFSSKEKEELSAEFSAKFSERLGELKKDLHLDDVRLHDRELYARLTDVIANLGDLSPEELDEVETLLGQLAETEEE